MTRDYSQVITKITQSAWLMTPTALRALLQIVEAKVQGTDINASDLRPAFHSQADGTPPVRSSKGIAVLPLMGPIFPRANLMTEMSGATSLEQFKGQFRELMANDLVGTIVLDVDSPGGIADGVLEMGEEIRAARESKRIVSVANTLAASAAYWLASQANEMYVSPSGMAGSVGVYAVHEDWSQFYQKEGVKHTLISAGEHKTEGNEFEPLSLEAHSHIQEMIDETYSEFLEAVAAGRNTTPDDVQLNFGGGRVLKANAAVETGMVDGIATLEDVVFQSTQAVVESGIAARHSIARFNTSYDADKEHSEPGTGMGGEPTPAPPPEEGDLAIVNGWRRESPPAAFEELEEGSLMNRQQLEELAGRLNISFSSETTDDELVTAIMGGVDDVVVPLNAARQAAQKSRSFREEFPEEYEQYQKLLTSDAENKARIFADNWERFSITENGATKKTTRGFSALTLECIKDMHMKLGTRTLTEGDLTELLDSIAQGGIVEHAEKGSARQREKSRAADPQASVKEKRQAFADAIQEKMKEDNLTFDKAMDLVSEEQPELAEAYLYGHVGG